MRIIGMNGPPRSGKDTIAKYINRIHDNEYRFKGDTTQYQNGAPYEWGCPIDIELRACVKRMRLAVFALMGLAYSDEKYEEIKDMPELLFNGDSVRQFMIRLMQEFIKPTYDVAFAVKATVADLAGSTLQYDNSRLLIITDIGFQEEVEYLEDFVGYENFMLVRLSQPGRDFSGDSRSYVEAMQVIDWPNRLGNDLFLSAKAVMHAANTKFGWEF